MKTIRFLSLALLIATAFCRGQDAPYGPGWYSSINASTTREFDPNSPSVLGVPPPVPGGTNVIAESITPEIAALARGLENDPKRIFDFVHDHIRYVHYFGSHKGAQLTLLERSGNDFDQCALLVALLRSAGWSPTYKFGVVSFPFSVSNHQDIKHWLGLTTTNTDWSSQSGMVGRINGHRGFPFHGSFSGMTNLLFLQHLWVQMTINGTNYLMDPSFKVSEPVAGINLNSEMGLNTTNLLNTAGGTATGDYVQALNEAALRVALQSCTTTLVSNLQQRFPNHSVQEVIGGQKVVSSAGGALSQSSAFRIETQRGAWPVSEWSYIPTNLMGVLEVSLLTSTNQFYSPSLKGERLSLTFTSGGLAQLWLEDTQAGSSVQTSGTSGSINVTLAVQHPCGTWDMSANNLVRSHSFDQTVTTTYQRTNSNYALIYGFGVANPRLLARQRQLEAYLQQGLADDSRQVRTETLYVMGLNWLLQTELSGQLLAREVGVIPTYLHRLGRTGQEAGRGYYIDVFAQLSSDLSGRDDNAASRQSEGQILQVGNYFDSAFEHGIIEQLQSSNLTAASTVKLLQLASANGQRLYLASSTNWTSGANVSARIKGYDVSALYNDFISKGYTLLLPSNGLIQIAGAGSWKGSGWVALCQTASNPAMSMMISGGFQGGFVSDPRATPSGETVSEISTEQPVYYSWESPTSVLPPQFGADPVSMADGTFYLAASDLSLGGAEPRGLNLSRFYSSSRRNSNPAAMAPGWLHNYVCSASEIPAPLAALGGTTPQQMAPMLVATRALLGIQDGTQRDPKSWAMAALIAKWGVDQIAKNGVSIVLGKDTIQFVKQPDGSYTPPANSTMTLLKTNGVFWLQERHGSTFRFNDQGLLASVVDLHNQSLNITYGSNNRVETVSDWKGRTLTFNYTGARLTSVTDGTRSVSYAYTNAFSPQGDLVSVTDPEGKMSSFGYDTNHQIVATIDALNRLVVSNQFDSFGRVVTQYSQGDTNRAWQIYWSGFQTVEQDPAGAKRRFSYDDKTRLIAREDALGNREQMFYDGQDHLIKSVSPLNTSNLFFYDNRHNLVRSVDPLGYTNSFNFDAQDRLLSTVDARGNPTTFGYNSKFQVTGITNATGDWVTNGYNTVDGVLLSRTDSAGTTSYGYDNQGYLNGITYPGILGSEGFLNNTRGDVLSHTNARKFVTSFQYNNRRELTNTIAPANLTTKVAFDSAGNVFSTTDARNFTTSNTWSATRKLLTTTLPATPQGVPTFTNRYDSRDWLSHTINPLQKVTLYTNDAAQRLISVTDPLFRTTRFVYDGQNRPTFTTNAANEVTRQVWNAKGELIQTTDGGDRVVKRKFDGAGNQILLTNRNGKVWQFRFDAANRLTNTISPLGRETKLAYNNRGLLQTVIEPSTDTANLFYDARGRLTNRTDSLGTVLYRYDANNNCTNLVEGGKTNIWTFDGYDRVSSYRDAETNLIQYQKDANGNVTNLIYPGGKAVKYQFDSLNRLTNVTDWANRKTSIEYDLASQATKITRPNGTVREMNYDAAGQLTNIVEKTASGNVINLFRLNWNAAARVEWEFAAPLPHAYTLPNRAMTFNEDNRIATFNGQDVTHDLDGNMTSGPLTNDTSASYTFDARNRLLSVGGISYGYDLAGNRVAITNGASVTRLVVNPNAALSQVLMRVKGGVTNYYVYGLGLLYEVSETPTATNTLTYHYDYRGSTVALTDGSGHVTDRMEYSAYGTITYRAGTNDTPFQFNGRYGVQTDANGLLYMRARYYNPYICRYINPDPAGFSGGLNFYAYGDGNPVSFIDPFGLCAGEAGWGWLDVSLGRLENVMDSAAFSLDAAMLQGIRTSAGFLLDLKIGNGRGNEPSGGRELNVLLLLLLRKAPAGGSAIAAEGEGALAGTIRNVNPTGGTMNCVNCSIATDATLGGNAASALRGGKTAISVLEDTYGGSFQPVSGQMQIGSILSQSGNGSRGIVFGQSLTTGFPGHVFNVLNNNGTIQFLDGQIGGSGLNNFNSLQNFQFLLTHPGTP